MGKSRCRRWSVGKKIGAAMRTVERVMGWRRSLRVHPLPGHPHRSVVPAGKHANGETKGTRDAKRDEVEEERL